MISYCNLILPLLGKNWSRGKKRGAFANFGPDRRGFKNRVGLALATKKTECS